MIVIPRNGRLFWFEYFQRHLKFFPTMCLNPNYGFKQSTLLVIKSVCVCVCVCGSFVKEKWKFN